MRRRKFIYFLVISSIIKFLQFSVYAKPDVESLISISAGGGSDFFEGNAGSFTGNFNIDFIPALRFSDNTALLPCYSGSYQGVQQLQQLAEGGYLYQGELNNIVSFILLKKLKSGLILKPKIGYKLQLLKETIDENWFEGLYDFHKLNCGIELEKKRDNSKMNLGYEFNWLIFPNYESLASYMGFYQPGKDLFDCLVNELFIKRASPFLKKMSIEYGYNFTYKYFTDQKKVLETTGYSSTNRYDLINSLGLNLAYPLKEFKLLKMRIKTLSGLNYDFTYNYSNQNYWERTTLMYIGGYYNYLENNIGPSFTFYFSPYLMGLTLSYEFSLRNYLNRPLQTVSGIYGEDKINQKKHTISVRTDLPIYKRLSGYALFNWQKVISNMEYEQYYKYNYTAGYYLAGLTYKY
ncbi:MAG: hypothetical protein AB1349_08630 [Elusimicrobiota bacterium]